MANSGTVSRLPATMTWKFVGWWDAGVLIDFCETLAERAGVTLLTSDSLGHGVIVDELAPVDGEHLIDSDVACWVECVVDPTVSKVFGLRIGIEGDVELVSWIEEVVVWIRAYSGDRRGGFGESRVTRALVGTIEHGSLKAIGDIEAVRRNRWSQNVSSIFGGMSVDCECARIIINGDGRLHSHGENALSAGRSCSCGAVSQKPHTLAVLDEVVHAASGRGVTMIERVKIWHEEANHQW
jgi:hypothetical protein